MSRVKIPTYVLLMNPLLKAFRDFGGSGTIEEIDEKVAEVMNLSNEQLEVLQDPKKGSRSKFAGTELKILEGSSGMIGAYGNWLKVRVAGGAEGYVAAWYVRK